MLKIADHLLLHNERLAVFCLQKIIFQEYIANFERLSKERFLFFGPDGVVTASATSAWLTSHILTD